MNKLNCILLLIGIFIFLMSVSLFRWNFFDSTPINVIQFSFRILSIATLLLTFVGANLIIDMVENFQHTKRNSGIIFILLLEIVIIHWYSSVHALVNSPYSNQSAYTFNSKNINRETNISGYYLDQYTLEKSIKNLDNATDCRGYSNGKVVHFTRTIGRKNINFQLKHEVHENSVIELPFAYIQNIVVMVAGKRVNTIESSHGLIQLKTEKHCLDTYSVKYSMSKMDTISIMITLISILCLIWISFFLNCLN